MSISRAVSYTLGMDALIVDRVLLDSYEIKKACPVEYSTGQAFLCLYQAAILRCFKYHI